MGKSLELFVTRVFLDFSHIETLSDSRYNCSTEPCRRASPRGCVPLELDDEGVVSSQEEVKIPRS